MKLKNFGRAAFALAASAAMILGMTSCSLSFTVGYLFITGSATGAGTNNGQIASYKIKNNDGTLPSSSTVGSGGPNPIQVVVNPTGTYLYVLNAGLGTNWVTVSGSTGVTSETVPINPANGAVFYRLVYP